MNVSDGECNLPSKLFLVKLHPHNLVRESLVEQTIDLGTSRQLQSIDGRRSTAFNGPFEILLKLLNAPAKCVSLRGGTALSALRKNRIYLTGAWLSF
jgi:hypothetical protein